MSKNRTQLEEEAKELGLDVSELETKAEVEEAIAEAKQSANENNPEGPEEERAVNTDTDNENPQDDRADVEAPMEPESKKGKKKAKALVLKTTKEVAFTINGKKSEGTEFSFESEEELAARKQLLVERYGAGVVEE